MPKTPGRMFIAKESFSIDRDGNTVSVTAGHTLVEEGHWLMDGREHLFEPAQVHFAVEEATSAPGAKRKR